LLTLVGPPGVGKTRLALQVAAELSEAFADSAHFVALAALSDPGLVAATIAKSLGLTDVNAESPDGQLLTFLHDKQLLLVLDNFEQVMPAAPFVAELLSAAPSVKGSSPAAPSCAWRSSASSRYRLWPCPISISFRRSTPWPAPRQWRSLWNGRRPPGPTFNSPAPTPPPPLKFAIASTASP